MYCKSKLLNFTTLERYHGGQEMLFCFHSFKFLTVAKYKLEVKCWSVLNTAVDIATALQEKGYHPKQVAEILNGLQTATRNRSHFQRQGQLHCIHRQIDLEISQRLTPAITTNFYGKPT